MCLSQIDVASSVLALKGAGFNILADLFKVEAIIAIFCSELTRSGLKKVSHLCANTKP